MVYIPIIQNCHAALHQVIDISSWLTIAANTMAGIEHTRVIGDINPQSIATTMLKISAPVELT